jgi:CHAT domain-containing protein
MRAIDDPSLGTLLVIADSLMDDNQSLPAPTALILGDDEPWIADEIASAQSSADLVVLSADGAANGLFVPGEGQLSLAVAFLMAGARTVCAPTLPVPAAAGVLPRMLERTVLGADPATAMREAQLAVSDEGNHPLHWSGWKVMGLG